MRGQWTKAKTLTAKHVTSPKFPFIDSQPVTSLLTYPITFHPLNIENIKQIARIAYNLIFCIFLTGNFRQDGDL